MFAILLIQSAIAGTMILPSVAEPPAPGQVAEWAVSSGDNGGAPFLVIDRAYSQLYAFDSSGVLQGIADVRTARESSVGSAADSGMQRSEDTRRDQMLLAGRLVMKGSRNEHGEVVLRVAEAPASHGRNSSPSPAGGARPADFAAYDTISFPAGRPNRVIEKLVTGKRVLVYVIPEIPPLAGLSPPDLPRFPAEQRWRR